MTFGVEDTVRMSDEQIAYELDQAQRLDHLAHTVRSYARVWVGDGSECSTRRGLDAFIDDMSRAESKLINAYGFTRSELEAEFFDAVCERLDELATERERSEFNASVEASW